MADSYYLKVMGRPELCRPDGRPVRLRVRKHLALLIYLVLEGRSVYRRDELVELLWPARTAKGRQSLSMAFTVLRVLFGDDCIRSKHLVTRFAGPPLVLDLDRLERGEITGGDLEPPLEVDGLLRDFEIEDAPAFQHWRDRKRAEFLPRIKAGILKLVDEVRRSGDTTAIRRYADRLLELDHLAEEGIAARMEAFAVQGDRLSALRVYESWKRDLAAELGAKPSEALETLAGRLRRPRGAGGPIAAPALLDSQPERPFVGRTAEYRLLFEAWEATKQFRSSHVLITGESGIGKSTLAMRFGAAASLAGAAVARVQCFELEQRIAFGTIGALVTSLLDQPGAVATAPESLAEIARIVPKVRERFPNLPTPRSVQGEAVRLHFAEGVFALFDALMEEQPLVLIVDDYPRSDEASLSVLHMLLRRSDNDRLMIVLAGRPQEPDDPPQAARVRRAVSYLPMTKIDLGLLNPEESYELVRSLVGTNKKCPSPLDRRAIVRSASGNPMALVLLTHDWLTNPDNPLAIVLTALHSDVPRAAFKAIEYDQLIDRMFPALTPRNRLALYLAAILGPRLNELEYFEVLNLSSTQTMAALSEMLERRVLRSTEKGLEFTNELLRTRIYLKAPAVTRTRLHSAVADRLIHARSDGKAIPGLEIAWHCLRAMRIDAATPFLITSARDAITHGAPDEASRALSAAVKYLKGSANVEARLLLAETCHEMGAWHDALFHLGQLRPSDLGERTARERATTLEIESRWRLGLYDGDELREICQKLITLIRDAPAASPRIRAALSAASIAADLRSDELSRELREQLNVLSCDALDSVQRSKTCIAEAMSYYHLRDGDLGRQRLLAAAAICDEIGATDSTYASIQIGLGTISASAGEYTQAITHLKKAYACASRLDNGMLMTQIACNLALCYSYEGPIDSYRRWSEVAWELCATTPVGSYDRVYAASVRCIAALDAEDGAGAYEAVAKLKLEESRAQKAWIRQAALLFLADIHYLMKEESAALAVIHRAREISNPELAIGFAGRFARWSTILHIREGNPARAWQELERYYQRLDHLDLIDQVEVLSSIIVVSQGIGVSQGIIVPAHEIEARLRKILAQLPPGCSHRLARLGLFTGSLKTAEPPKNSVETVAQVAG